MIGVEIMIDICWINYYRVVISFVEFNLLDNICGSEQNHCPINRHLNITPPDKQAINLIKEE